MPHALIWTADDPSKLGPQAATELADPTNELVVSAGAIWEIAIKVGQGKLSLTMPFGEWMNKAITDLAATILLKIEHADAQTQLPGRGDPFDGLLAAQSNVERMVLVSNDAGLDPHGVQRLW